MLTSKYLSSALLLLIVVGLAWGKSSHYPTDSVEESDSNNLKVKSSFYMAMPMFMRNAIDAFTSTQGPPPTTQRPCEVTSCLNNGTLMPGGQNGSSCPRCDCAPGCNGTMCETCAPASTTPAPTTRINCNTLSCMHGGSAINYGNGSCSCWCPNGYFGDFCEYSRICQTEYGVYCNNGGTPTWSPYTGSCVCSCPSCYYGTNCDYYDSMYCNPSSTPSYTTRPSCNSLNCLPMGGEVVYPNGTDCRCGCATGFSGDYCEIINTCIYQVSCGSGRIYYDPAMARCQCDCPPGYYGTNCYYSIE